ncbi:MAG TPA: hypothetical protein VLZ75_01635 [Chitinophagales bacterium]|nr:hypothetical protein [Chitinophagales bacterium]
MTDTHQDQAPSSIIVIIFSAFLSATAFILASFIPTALELPKENDLFEIFVGIISILFGIGFTTFVIKKIHRTTSFARIFVSGWMTALVMSLFVSIFYLVAFHQEWIPLEAESDTVSIISVVILKYNALGMMFSSLIALIFKNNG